MLNLIMAAMISYQASPQRGPPPPPPVMYSHRGAYFLRPPSATLTAEWNCPGSDRASMARIAIRDYYDFQGRQAFAVELVALRVNGVAVARPVFDRVANLFATLVEVGAFQGRCRGREQQLLVQGFVRGGDPRTPSIFELVLTTTR